MKIKFIYVISSLIFLIGCQSRSTKNETKIDSFENDQENFEEFIYKFSIDSSYQIDHIRNGLIKEKTKKWNFERFSFGIEFSTLLFSDLKIDFQTEYFRQIDDSTISISFFKLDDFNFNELTFAQRLKSWILKDFETNKVDTSLTKGIFPFLSNFSKNSTFMKRRILSSAIQIEYDELSKSEIEKQPPNIWFEVDDYIFREIYLVDKLSIDHEFCLYVKGEGTGYHLELYYKLIDNKWFLVKEKNLGV